MVVVGLVYRGTVLRPVPAMEPPLFRPPGVGLDRLQIAAAVSGRFHGTMVFRLDAEYDGGSSIGTGSRRNGREKTHGGSRSVDRFKAAHAVVGGDADALEYCTSVGGDFRRRNSRQGMGTRAPLPSGGLCLDSGTDWIVPHRVGPGCLWGWHVAVCSGMGCRMGGAAPKDLHPNIPFSTSTG